MRYVVIQAWHVVVLESRGGQFQTRCGRWSRGDVTTTLPLDQKSCETCLRLARHDAEKA
jgi:hypothetical protein